MFWILFFISGYWFIVYKLQAEAYVLLPSVDDWDSSYMIFDIVFGIILAFRLLSIVFKIVEQSKIDIFLIDWEPTYSSNDPTKQTKSNTDTAKVWRSIFVANEFNELQSEYRYIRPETTLIWFVFFMKALGWEYLAQANPDMTPY